MINKLINAEVYGMSKYANILNEANKANLSQYLNEKEHMSNMDYDQVLKAVFAYHGEDPDAMDELSKERKKEIYDDIDRCWDENEDRVSDSCPIDLHEYID